MTMSMAARWYGRRLPWPPVLRARRARYRVGMARLEYPSTDSAEAQLDGILDWRSADFNTRQQAVLALAEQLTTNVDVDDATFEAARAHLSPRELVELVATVAYYNMVARFLIGLRIDLEA